MNKRTNYINYVVDVICWPADGRARMDMITSFNVHFHCVCIHIYINVEVFIFVYILQKIGGITYAV